MRPVTILLCGALIGCAAHARVADQPTPAAARTAIVQFGELAPTVTLAGIIAPLQNVGISSSLQEPAAGVYVHEGQYVSAGTVLAELDVSDLRANLVSAERSAAEANAKVSQTGYQSTLALSQGTSDFVNARAQLQQARQHLTYDQTTLQRNQSLLKQGYVPQQTVDQMQTQVLTDESQVRAAEAALRNAAVNVKVNGTPEQGLQASNVEASRAAAASAQAQAQQLEVQIAKGTIVSPIDGVVINRNLNPGEYPGSRQIFTIQQTNAVYAMLNASSDEVFRIQPHRRATIHIGSLGNVTTTGVVEAVLGQAQPGSTNFVVKVRIPNPQRRLQSGMVVSADLPLPAQSGLIVPMAAFTDDSHTAVRTIDSSGDVRQVNVRAIADDGRRAIVDGLKAGARVVIGT
ncbi:MAG: efflux RND transporter periplasmic adaptor subunit [Candidatus Eremiobacteraeota bacterium]|nr:efflux RND transporter periplasmic adaptor subunit [Candidatus Eremiobacteraeota bacterium]